LPAPRSVSGEQVRQCRSGLLAVSIVHNCIWPGCCDVLAGLPSAESTEPSVRVPVLSGWRGCGAGWREDRVDQVPFGWGLGLRLQVLSVPLPLPSDLPVLLLWTSCLVRTAGLLCPHQVRRELRSSPTLVFLWWLRPHLHDCLCLTPRPEPWCALWARPALGPLWVL
jgi:hypothetical protein